MRSKISKRILSETSQETIDKVNEYSDGLILKNEVMKKTINMTFKMNEENIVRFESWFRQQEEVIDFRIIPDTSKLYEEDSNFKKLVKAVKDAQRVRDIYINEHNHNG